MNDKQILRALASELMEIASLPAQQETRRLWRKLNELTPERPMVAIDQVCWNEMNFDGSLTLRCEDAECRQYEQSMRRKLFQWKHFPADMVVEGVLSVPMALSDTGFGVHIEEHVLSTDETNDVVSHSYINQFTTDDDLEKVQMPVLTHDEAETSRRLQRARELFDGTLTVVPAGYDPYLSVWDPISTWMGVEGMLYGLIDRPEFMLSLAKRLVDGYMSKLDQAEALGVLTGPQHLIHCTGAYTDQLPAPGFDPARPRTRDIWMFGLAQPFSTISPAMYDEYEIEVCMPLFERFGLVYYGCCDPLDRKMAEVLRIPHLRKVSASPWANEQSMAHSLGRDFVFSRKPNPAQLAFVSFHEDQVRAHLQASVDCCRATGTPIEIILKDISTVLGKPDRLFQWEKIAMDVARQ